MKCLNCDSEELCGVVTIEKVIPLTQRGGSLNVAGEKVTQKDLKNQWDKTHDMQGDRYVRGPIICLECETEHVYLKGVQPSLYTLEYEKVKNMSVEEILSKLEILQDTGGGIADPDEDDDEDE